MKVSLATKIFVGFMAVLACSALMAFFAVREIRQVAEDLRTIKDGHLVLARLAAQLETHQQNRFRDLERGIEEPERSNRALILRIALAYFPDVIQASIDDIRTVCGRQQPKGGVDRACQEIGGTLETIENRHDGLTELNQQLLATTATATTGVAAATTRLDEVESTLRAETYQLNKALNDATDRAVRRAEQDERNAIWRVLMMTAIALAIGLILSFLANRSLAPIRKLAQAISRGDYEANVDVRGDEELASLADELRRMARAQKEREEALDRQADELERAYRRVEELKRYHESIVRSLRTGVVVTDRALTITSTNRAAVEYWGLDPEQVRGRAIHAIPPMQALADQLDPQSLLEEAATLELTAVQLGDRLADVTIAPLENERGTVLGTVVALEDVTEAVRTKEALIRSERLAAIGRMSAHVTHEIRNPLSSIGLNAEMLRDLGQQDSQEATELCEAIIREVDRLTAITEEYLKFARLPRPELRDADARLLLRTIAAFVQRDCAAANVELVVELSPDVPALSVDADQIRQALLNLVRNAKESMPEGGNITLGARTVDGGVGLFVRDTGNGISPDDQARIFDPFYSTKLTGTGLGLALCQQIVTEHDGELRVNSEVGAGTEFEIWLPSGQTSKMTALLDPVADETREAS